MRTLPRALVLSVWALTLAASSLFIPTVSSAEPPSYVMEWGIYGSGPGEFMTVRDIAVDAGGFVYVLDYGNCRVQKFTRDGVFVTAWGSCGDGPGQLYQPQGIAVDPTGFVYVADSYNHRIQKFTLSGEFVGIWGSQGSGAGYFNGPRGVAVDSQGNVYVADTFNDRIQKLNQNGIYLTQWDGSSGAGGQLDRPVALDIGADGNVYVVDYGNYQIQKFNPIGVYIHSWGESGSGEGQMGLSHGLDASPAGIVYLADSQNNRIQIFTDYGVFTDEFGSFGSTAGQFNDPREVTANADSLLYVADCNNNRVQVFEIPGAPAPLPNQLSIGYGRGIPAGSTVMVPVELRTNTPALVLEFKVQDTPDWLTCVDVWPTDRASDMTAEFTDTGITHILVYDAYAGQISMGSGPILNLEIEIDPAAVLGDSISLDLLDVVVADPHGDPVQIDVQGGMFYVTRLPGDINGDNLVDVGDLVRLTEIILGNGTAPSPEELAAADCNGDVSINALDVACLLNSITGGPASPTAGLLFASGAEGLQDLRLRSEGDVRGLQLNFPAGTEIDLAGVDLPDFHIYEGTLATGERSVLAFDPAGRSWESGGQTLLRATLPPASVRAYGPGGRALTVSTTAEEIRLGGAPVTAGIRALPAQPNPFRSSTSIRFTTGSKGMVKISVFDIKGGLVSALPEREFEPGTYSLAWNAVDRAGRSLPAGLYLALIEAPGGRSSVRLTHLGP